MSVHEEDIKRLERAAEKLENRLGAFPERLLYTKAFMMKLESVRSKAQDVLMSCLKEDFRREIQRVCDYAGYRPYNVIMPIAYTFSLLGANTPVEAFWGTSERDESERGCFSLVVMGRTGSGKTRFISSPLKRVRRLEKAGRDEIRNEMIKKSNRVKHLEVKEGKEGLTQEEVRELTDLREWLKEQSPIFYTMATTEKMLEALSVKGVAALVVDEGKLFIASVFGTRSSTGVHLGSLINHLFDGEDIYYGTKSNYLGTDLGDYSFSVFFNSQESVLRDAEKAYGDITNVIGRFDLVFIEEAERRSVVKMGRKRPDLSTPSITSALESYYNTCSRYDYMSSDIKLNLNYFVDIHSSLCDFWMSLDELGGIPQRISDVIIKYRDRWDAYARGLTPMCSTEEDLSRAVGATLLLSTLNVIEYYLKDAKAQDVTGSDASIEQFLKKNGVYEIITEAIDAQRRGEGDGKIRAGKLMKAYRDATGKTSRSTYRSFIEELVKKGVLVAETPKGYEEVVDFISTKEAETIDKITYDFGLQYLLQ